MLSKCVSTLVLDETKEESYMKYTLDCDMQDGLVFIDESYLSELNDDELLYETVRKINPFFLKSCLTQCFVTKEEE